jgi:hypothetical protein
MGVPVPDVTSLPAILLYGIAGICLLIPLLVWKQHAFGYYLAWTFFAAMGITELAHFIFSLFKEQPYCYFPGMWRLFHWHRQLGGVCGSYEYPIKANKYRSKLTS